jgi:hypothetical protein
MREIARIEAMGVRIVLNHKVEDLRAEKTAGNFDAVFIAIGAGVAQHVDIPARDAARVLDALSLLRDVEAGEPPRLGRRVVVYGGGIPRWTRRAPLGAWAPTTRSSFIGVIAHICRHMPSKPTRR